MTTDEHIEYVIADIKQGIEYTQVCGKFYSTKGHPFGQRVFAMTRAALKKMLERKIIYKQGQKLLLVEDKPTSD